MWPLNPKKKPKKKAPKRGQKQAQSLKRRRLLSSCFRGVLIILVVLGVTGSVYIWQSGLYQQWAMEAGDTLDRKFSEAGFEVGEVRITGQQNTGLQQIRDALALYDGQSIISLDLEEMLLRVEALPWVRSATLIRIMPDALEVTITEHQAVAVWQSKGKLYLVERGGQVITDRGVEKYNHLPQIVGYGASENLAELLALKASYPDLFGRVKSAVWIGGRRWDLNLDNGIKIKLPEKGPDLAWQQLYEYESRQNILSKDILVIDLRLPDKTVIRLTPEEASRRRLIKKNAKEESI